MTPGLSRLCLLVTALAMLMISVWMYWPGITGPSLLDDRSSIAVLSGLHHAPGTAVDYVLDNKSGPLGRPVSMATFVLEEVYFEGDTKVRKAVNIILHALTGLLVIWLYALLLAWAKIPRFGWFAVLGGALWLFSPLFVSTVLYVVQRMAMLSTLFMLLACIVYVYWRHTLLRSLPGILLSVALLLCIALAILSKENGVLVIPALVVLEVFWFQGRSDKGDITPVLRKGSLFLLWGGLLLAILGFLIAFNGLEASYGRREFSLYERLLTQSRIVWDYLWQLVWPDVPRMGVFHDDVEISRSLTEPGTTVIALVAWLGSLLVGLCLLRWRIGKRMVGAALLFVIGHLLESTVLPLELYFEHRNYFPAVGLFLLVSLLLGSIAQRWPQTANPILAWMTVWVVLLGFTTSSQVQIWSSAPLLRLNHVTQHPSSFRANEEMALHLARLGALDAGLEYSRRANALSTQERSGDGQLREIGMHCMAGRDIPPALLAELGQSDPLRPFAIVSSMRGLLDVFNSGACSAQDYRAFADRMAEIFLSPQSTATAAANFYSILAAVENSLERYNLAYAYMQRALERKPNNVVNLLMQLHFTSILDKRAEAGNLLAQLQRLRREGRLNTSQRQTLELYE